MNLLDKCVDVSGISRTDYTKEELAQIAHGEYTRGFRIGRALARYHNRKRLGSEGPPVRPLIL